MSATKIASTSRAGQALAQLSTWPSLQVYRADCGAGIGVGTRTRAGQILHFHDGDHAAIYLTSPVINRMRDVLAQSGIDIGVRDDWLRMRLETPTDTALLVMLLSVAIKVNSAPAPIRPDQAAPCRSATVRGTHRTMSRA